LPAFTGVCVVKTISRRVAAQALHVRRDHLDAGEHGVALVEVVGRHRDPQPGEGARPADAEQHLLRDAHVGAHLVESVRDPAVRGARGLDQVERHVPEARGHPDVAGHLGATHVDTHVHAGVTQIRVIVAGKLLVGLAVGADPLHRVPVFPQQPDADHRQLEVRRRLDEVAGQDAQPPRVDGKRLVQPELHAEIGDVRCALHAGSGARSEDVPEAEQGGG
jgi:hypothetical protein